jgi:hypothetical protein
MKFNLRARLTAEFVGSAFLVAAVVGSGIMGERLAGGNVAIALLANTIATGAALVALILTFGPISGAHLNPAVTVADAIEHGIAWPDALAYIAVQCAGGVAERSSRISCSDCAGILSQLIPVTDGRWSSASSWLRSDCCRLSGDVRGCAQELCRSRLPATSPPLTGSPRQPRLQTRQ